MSLSAGDHVLMDCVANGDATALECLYDRYNALLYSLALRIVGDPRGAEEVLQDSFFQLWRNASQFASLRGSVIGWLLTVTRQRAISRIGRHSASSFDSESLHPNDVLTRRDVGPSALEQQVARQLVCSAFAGLCKEEQETITAAYFDGWTCEEIATRTKTPLETIKSRLRTALPAMRRALSNQQLSLSAASAQCTATLKDILITEELHSRPCKQRDPLREKAALRTLGQVVATTPGGLIDSFLQLSLELCGAGTAGLSLLEEGLDGGDLFRWTNLAGRLSQLVGGTTPRNFSPCGVTLDRDSAQLFANPGRYFTYFNDVEVPIVEGLVIPIHVGTKTKGTIWIVSHGDSLGFDSEDARIMTGLSEFVGCALNLIGLVDMNLCGPGIS